MPRAAVRIDGLTEAKATLDALPEAFRETVARTLEGGASIILSEALVRVPVDEGELRASLGRNIREDGLQASIGSGAVYARFVEFATNDTPAQPFLWPAFRVGARYVRNRMRTWAAEVGEKIRFKTKRGRRPKVAA